MTTHEGEYRHPDAAADAGHPADLTPLLADTPPRDIEGRVVAALSERGAFARTARERVSAVAVAAAVVAFAAGVGAGAVWQGPASRDAVGSPASSPRAAEGGMMWALVLLEGQGYRAPAGAAEAERRVAALAGWAGELAEAGRLVIAEELGPPVRVLPVGADPPASALGLGLFLIRANSAREAVRLASESPHIDHGGRVAVQPVVPH